MIEYIEGNILDTDCDIICHQVNCQGVMGAGLAKQIKEKYLEAYTYYRHFCYITYNKSTLLGNIQKIECHDGRNVVNMFSQEKYGRDRQYTDYQALEKCIRKVSELAPHYENGVAFPYGLGCGLAGGDWNIVKGLIEKYFKDSEIVCKIYKYNK